MNVLRETCFVRHPDTLLLQIDLKATKYLVFIYFVKITKAANTLY